MTQNSLQYKLSDGFIHHWLVAGPLTSDLSEDVVDVSDAGFFQRFYELDSGITLPPVDVGSLGSLTEKNPLLIWRYYRCQPDHFVDFSDFYPTRCYVRSWAYAQLEVPIEKAIKLILTTNGPADVWLNGEHINRIEHMKRHFPKSVQIPAVLQAGSNEILLRFETIGLRSTQQKLALEIQDVSEADSAISIPTDIETDLLKKRQDVEEVIQAAYTDRYVYGYMDGDRYSRNEPISIHFAEGLKTSANITFRCQSFEGDIYNEGTTLCNSAAEVDLAVLFPLRSGPLHLAMLPLAEEYYRKKVRLERKDLFYVVRSDYSSKVYRSFQVRAKEALEDASERRNESIYSEIAKMALKRWENVKSPMITAAVKRVGQHQAGSVLDLLGILDVLLRFKTKKAGLAELKAALEGSVIGFRYWKDDPGSDIMDFSSESRQIVFHTCEILAGQLMPDQVFTHSGKNGQWHKERGEKLAAAWMQRHGMFGFAEWDSPASVEESLAALTFLVDFAANDSLGELASILMDKIFFSLALNSFYGVYGSSRGASDTASLLSARLGATSGISRLMWGMGNFNEHVMGTVCLARCRNYELPSLIRNIAKERIKALWSRERHKQPDTEREVNKVLYRTADFMLSSAQDYYPGAQGHQEHIWQATLGPDALVSVNHPVCLSEDDAHSPNLWRGNGVLPRVAQWGDVLVALYQLPADDWLGFTHAYFPAVAFDETQVKDGWAFARQGKGYLAITASKGFEFINTGKTAFRELRSHADQNIWLCHMGQELLDGSFEDFQNKILAMEVSFEGLKIRLQSLRKDQITFGWKEPLVVNDQEQSLKDFKHFESPYCTADFPAAQMEIIYQERGVRLNFE